MPSVALPPDLAARRRRSRRVYGAVVLAALVAVGLTMGIVIGTGEAAHARLVTGTAAPTVPGGTVRPAPTQVWHTDDTAARDNPLWVGTVVTSSTHSLVGRDAATGRVRWSYTRSDVTVCDAAQRDGRAFVLFGHEERGAFICDELSTFDAETGARGWFRTLPDTSGQGTFMFGGTGLVVAFPQSFHAMRASDGVDRFPMVTTTGADCRFTAVVAGVSGVLASERCTDGEHLALWSNDGAKDQPQRLWRVGVSQGVTAVGETTVGAFAYSPVSGTLSRYSVDTGSTQSAPTLDPATTGPVRSTQVIGNDLLLGLGDRVYDVTQSGTVSWSAAAAGPPTTTGGDVPQVLVPTSGGVQVLSLDTGQGVASYTLPAGSSGPSGSGSAPAGGSGPRVYAAGGGLLVAGPGLSYLR